MAKLDDLLADQSLFHIVPGAQAIISANGNFRQVDVYVRGAGLYAAVGAGFVRLHDNGGTSNPKVRLISLIAPMIQLTERAELGRLTVAAIIEEPPRIETARRKGLPKPEA